jgi:hypothetical protein
LNVTAATESHDIARAPADAATIALVDELKTLAADTLSRGIERMFDGADDMLFEMARRATNNKDQRIYFDTMRVVRLGRPKIGKIFREEIARGFEPDADKVEDTHTSDLTFEDLSLQEAKSLEESIAISSMATKAENLYSHLLFEIGRRIEWLTKEKNARISASALAPSTISSAFRRSAEALDVEFDIELVIFKLFDRLVISDLGELYNRVLRFCEQNGVKPAAVTAPMPRAAGPSGMIGGAGMPGDGAAMQPGMPGSGTTNGTGMAAMPQGYGFAQPPMMDAATLNALRSLGSRGLAQIPSGANAPGYYGDVQLGNDLATAASGQIVPGWEAPRAYAYVQRAGAVGQMFNELMQDPTLPAPLKPRFDQLRFSVIKSALHDASFFADRQHPVRGLMNELTTLAAGARASGMEALRRIEELVGSIQSQFDVAADEVRTQTALPGPVDEKTLEQFFAQQKEDARQRRQAIIERTRRVVAEELQLHTLSRNVPEPVWPLLNAGWAPLAALRLLKQGAGSDAWRDAMDILGRVLDSIDPRRPAARSELAVESLERDLGARLSDIGMIPERISALLRSWRQGLAEVEAAPLPGARQPAIEPLAVEVPPARAETDVVATDAAPPADDAVAPIPARDDTSALLAEIPFELEHPGATALPEELAPVESEAERAPVSVGPEIDEPAPIDEDEDELPTVVASEPADATPALASFLTAPSPEPTAAPGDDNAPADPVTLLDLLMVLSSWFRVYDHDRQQNRWLKVVAHHPADGTVTFAEFNGHNKLQLQTQTFLDDLVAGRAEPIDLGPAARRSLDAYLDARRNHAEATARAA